jgi:hypothetical protein
MTATATDTLTVTALDRKDAPDIARRQWEGFGFRVLRIVEVNPGRIVGTWRVTADVEVVRA